jgi:Cohesin domain.
MKKKVLGIIIATALLFSFASIQTFAVTGTPTITVNGASGTAGSQVSVTLSVANNPGISSARLNVAYNSALTLISAQNGGLIPNAMFQGPPAGANPATYIWASTENSTANGTLLTLTFSIAADAQGSLPVSVTYGANDILNVDDANVNFNVVNSSVEVIASTPEIYGSNLTAKYNNEFEYAISIKNNPGFVATTLNISYDKTKLEYIPYGANTSDAKGEVFDFVGSTFVINETKTDTGVVIIASASAYNATADGVLFNLKFKVIDNTFTTTQIGVDVTELRGSGGTSPSFIETPGTITRDTSSQPVLVGVLGDASGDNVSYGI